MQYWRTADFASMGMTATGKAMWEVNYVAGRAVNRVGLAVDAKENQGPANPYNNQAAIFPSAGTTSSIVPPLLARHRRGGCGRLRDARHRGQAAHARARQGGPERLLVPVPPSLVCPPTRMRMAS